MYAAGDHGGGKVMRAGDHVGDDFGFSGIGDGGFENADDRGGARIQANDLADDRGIALADGGPETVGKDRGAGGLGAVVAIVEQTPEDGAQAHDVEIRATDNAGAHFARFAQTDHGEADGGEVAESVYGFDASFEIANFGDGECGVFRADAEGALADVDEAVFAAVDEGPQEDATDYAEDGGVGANAEGQGEDYGDGEALGVRQGAEGESQVVGDEIGDCVHATTS